MQEPKDTAFPCVVGALGWQHSGWEGSYYPPDLPAEWRLPYYANDFSGVLVPAWQWTRADPSTLRQWQEDTPEGFAIFLEIGEPPPPDVRSLADLLGNRLAGLVAMAPASCPGSLRAATLAQALSGPAEVVLVRAADLAQPRLLGKQFTALAERPVRPLALIVPDEVAPAALQELRILAELTSLA